MNLLDAAVAEMDDGVGDSRGLIAVGCHQDGRLALAGGAPQQLHDDAGAGGVKVADGLVRKKHFRRMHQRAGDRDPLHLASRELMGQPLRIRFHFHPAQAFQCIGPAHCFPRQHQGKLNVLDRAQRREQIEELEYEADFRAANFRQAGVIEARSICTVEENEPGRRKVHGAGKVQQRRLAAAAAPDERDELALGDFERDAVEGQNTFVVSLVFLGDVFEPEDRQFSGYTGGSQVPRSASPAGTRFLSVQQKATLERHVVVGNPLLGSRARFAGLIRIGFLSDEILFKEESERLLESDRISKIIFDNRSESGRTGS